MPVVGVLPGQDARSGAYLFCFDVRRGAGERGVRCHRRAALHDIPFGAAGSLRAGRVGAAQHLALHRAADGAACGGRAGLAGAVDPRDVDPDHQPFSLLPVLMSERRSSPAAPALTVTSRGGGPTDPSHYAELRRGIIHTAVTRPVAGALVLAFLLCIYGVPIAQAVLEKVKGDDSILRDLFRRA